MNCQRIGHLLPRRFTWIWIGLFCFTCQTELLCHGQETRASNGPDELLQASKQIDEASIRSHIRFLSHDLLEGRGPASRGDELAQLYMATQMQGLGIVPAGEKGWLQKVPLVGVATKAPDVLELQGKVESVRLKYFDDYIAVSGRPQETVELKNREIVFVGYGIQAPEYQWDDFKGVDVSGKILLMLNNDPADAPDIFEGKRRLYYGRWDYKYEIAAAKGAAGAMIIHTTESAGYPFSVVQTSWTGEEFELRDSNSKRLDMKGWVTDASARRMVHAAGMDLDELRKSAEQRDFHPVSLGMPVSMQLSCAVRTQDTANVLGMIEGSDTKLKNEFVIFMAHHDHIGLAAQRNASGDMIYNGAIDNASGSATLLAIAKACRALKTPLPRSLLFAAVGAEEQGLLGSKYFAEHPTIAPGRMAAVINMDGISFLGRTHDINVIGGGKSNLDQVLESMARVQKRVVTQDHFPDRGYYYRSDQFSLAKIGVPAIYLHAGIQVVGKPDRWGKQQQMDWVEKHYHQPSDEYREDWDLSGAVEDAQLLFLVGCEVAKQASMPAWKPGDEFESARLSALKAVTQ